MTQQQLETLAELQLFLDILASDYDLKTVTVAFQ